MTPGSRRVAGAATISNLAEIFSYDVDFTSDLKEGHSFSVSFSGRCDQIG